MSAAAQTADGLATALLGGAWTPSQMSRRLTIALGVRRAPPWVRALTLETLAAYRDPPTDRPRELAAFLQQTTAWRAAWDQRPRPVVRHWAPRPTTLARHPWPVTALPDLGALARLLDVDQGELAWFADVRSLERSCAPRLRHYTWTAVVEADGGRRLLAAPKSRLKEIQRRLLRHVLERIPVHDAAHGAVAGRSVRTATAPHAGATVVIRLDLRAFFTSIPAGRVWGLLREAGLPEAVAHTVTGLLTTVAPRVVTREPAFRIPHLPQGAPSSPRTANLVAFTLDRRLTALAARFDARYTRYVDDLTFSGGSSLRTARSRFVASVEQVVRAEGFTVNERKTVVLGDSGRQLVLGAVVNVAPAVPRRDRDLLRAILHNCVVHGWRSQARGLGREELRAQLLGRIAWVGSLHAEHGRQLRASADQIDWN